MVAQGQFRQLSEELGLGCTFEVESGSTLGAVSLVLGMSDITGIDVQAMDADDDD